MNRWDVVDAVVVSVVVSVFVVVVVLVVVDCDGDVGLVNSVYWGYLSHLDAQTGHEFSNYFLNFRVTFLQEFAGPYDMADVIFDRTIYVSSRQICLFCNVKYL